MDIPYTAYLEDLSGIARIADAHGFCHIRNVFAPNEMADFLNAMADIQTAGAEMDIARHPVLRRLLCDRRILDVASTLLGHQLVYYGQSNINYEPAIGPLTLSPYRELHTDARGMPTSLYKTWKPTSGAIYRGYRFAIYFQDYTAASGGLKVCPGSHRGDPDDYARKTFFEQNDSSIVVDGIPGRISKTRFPIHNLATTPGDLVVWNLRLFHAAGARRLRSNPDLGFHPDTEDAIERLNAELFLPPPGPRNALFFDYGTPTEETDLYIKHLAIRFQQVQLEKLMACEFDHGETRRALEQEGIAVRADKLLVPLAIWLASTAAESNRNAAMDKVRNIVVERAVAIAQRQHEYSSYHSYFPAEGFRAAAALGMQEAGRYLGDAILARYKESGLGTKGTPT